MSDIIRPVLAITLGDPAGVGPEIIVKALADPAVYAALPAPGDRRPAHADPRRRLGRPAAAAVRAGWTTPVPAVTCRGSITILDLANADPADIAAGPAQRGGRPRRCGVRLPGV